MFKPFLFYFSFLLLAPLAWSQHRSSGHLSHSVSTYSATSKSGVLDNSHPQFTHNGYKKLTPKLSTPWTKKVSLMQPWPEYPRPHLVRDDWVNFNGLWEFQEGHSLDDVNNPPFGKPLDERVLVPFCLESALSGIGRQTKYSWYRHKFEVPHSFSGNRVLLNFGAVDYQTTVFINGKNVGNHTGGYDRFSFDITAHLDRHAYNELLIFVYDPTDTDDQIIPLGKQRNVPSHIFYTPCSGIWQTVDIESVPNEHIDDIELRADMNGLVDVIVKTNTPTKKTGYSINFKNPTNAAEIVASAQGKANSPFQFKVPSPSLWSPDSPTVYEVVITLNSAKGEKDVVQTYTAFRTIAVAHVKGVQRVILNNKPIFQFGPLDQGYWPDGIYTAPTYEALVYDIQFLKDHKFNMIRKHIKTEPALYYYAAAKIGMLVMQDMPALSNLPNEEQQAEFERQLKIIFQQHMSFPAVTSFVIYNEGWGQLPSAPEVHITRDVRKLVKGQQLIDSVTGWHDYAYLNSNQSIGDYADNHHYATPQCGTPFYSLASAPYDSRRVGFQGEFGGIGHNVTIDHLWNDPQAIDAINQTYEITLDLQTFNYRALKVIEELREQTELFSCSGGVYTETTDIEGEVNGLMTYDRAFNRTDLKRWQETIQSLYDTLAARV